MRQTVMTASFLRASLFTSVVSFGVAAFAGRDRRADAGDRLRAVEGQRGARGLAGPAGTSRCSLTTTGSAARVVTRHRRVTTHVRVT